MKNICKHSIILMLLTTMTFWSCRKEMNDVKYNGVEPTVEKFFPKNVKVKPEIKRVFDYLKKKNVENGFVEKFALKEGFALWNKAVVFYSKKNVLYRGDSSSVTPYYIKIPLAETDEPLVKGFLLARVTDQIQLLLVRGNAYEGLPNGSINDSTLNAEDLAVQIMLLNKKIYGFSSFELLDEKLFNSNLTAGTNETLKINDSKLELSDVQEQVDQTTQQRFVTTTVRHCQWVQHHTCTCTDRDNCDLYKPTGCPNGTCKDETTFDCVDIRYTYIDNAEDEWVNYGGGVIDEDNGGGGYNGSIINNPCQDYANATILIFNPCENNHGWILNLENNFQDIAEPPFIWVYDGDEYEDFYDHFPNEEIDFTIQASDGYETKYPLFTTMLKNLKTFVKDNPKVLQALVTYSGFSKQTIIDHLTFGQGPIIKIEEMTGRFGYYSKSNGVNTLKIRASYVRGLELSSLQSTKEATAFLLAATILHEYIHYSTNSNNVSEGVYDFGYGFERDAFNVIVDESNAAQVVIKFSKYF